VYWWRSERLLSRGYGRSNRNKGVSGWRSPRANPDNDCRNSVNPLIEISCGQRTLRRLAIRYRKPYLARHTSVSWNLIIGRPPLLVAKEHGHRISTLFSVYAAWIEGAVEADIGAIRDAMNRTGGEVREATTPTAVLAAQIAPFAEYPSTAIATEASPRETDEASPGVFATGYANKWQPLDYNLLKSKENFNGKGGTRIVRHPQLNQQPNDFSGPLSPESPPESPDLPADLPVAQRSCPR
jgi:hypothetical protein